MKYELLSKEQLLKEFKNVCVECSKKEERLGNLRKQLSKSNQEIQELKNSIVYIVSENSRLESEKAALVVQLETLHKPKGRVKKNDTK